MTRHSTWPRCARRAVLVTVSLAGFALLSACVSNEQQQTGDDPLLVAGASDLMPAFTIIGAEFEEATGQRVVFTFGSSGQLAQQLAEGAPFDVYASADTAFVDQVLESGVGDADSRATYALGRIVLWSSSENWRQWRTLDDVVADNEVRVVAIANPEHAPYGRAARDAFEAVSLWNAIEPRLVYGENVTDTQRLAATGNADVAVIALSLAIAADEAGDGRWVVIDDHLHDPLQQDLIVTTPDSDRAMLARQFVGYVGSDDGRQVMRRFGFLLPGDDASSTGLQ